MIENNRIVLSKLSMRNLLKSDVRGGCIPFRNSDPAPCPPGFMESI